MSVRKFLSLSVRRGFVSFTSKRAFSATNFSNIYQRMGCSISRPQVKKSASSEDEYVEGVVCQEQDIKENEMKAFELDGVGKVLVVKQHGRLNAIGSKCTHYGAPLEAGALGDGRVRCPYHGACYNIVTGDIEDFPGLDSIPCYEVQVRDGNVNVRARRADLKSNKRIKQMCSLDSRESQHYVIIGGGPSAATCVETLRQEGFSGKISMVAKENCLPYDRVKVSKSMDSEIEKLQLRNDDFYMNHSIDVLKNTEAVKLDANNSKVTLNNGKVLDYSKLFVATGCTPLKAPIPGCDYKNVFVLRTVEDGKAVHSVLNGDKEVVILGASFIAMEAASYCVSKAKKVTVIGRDTVPFRALLGTEIGEAVKKLFVDKGVNFIMNSGMRACIGSDEGVVTQVELVNGDKLKADIVIMGVGSRFNTDFMKDSGVELQGNGSVEVNMFMQTNVENVFAGGDIALAPVYASDNEKSAIGHYSLAHYHGRIAALNMLNKQSAAKAVPYFWTMLFGKGIRYAGHGKHDEILYSGNVAELNFVAYYLKGDRVIAISTCGKDVIAGEYAERRAQGKELYRQDLGINLVGWSDHFAGKL